jgi:hypothetical protein
VLALMKRVTIIPSHQMTLFGPRITIFTKDGKSYTKQSTGREFLWDFEEEVRRLADIQVDEIACLVDFGLPFQTVIDALPKLDELRRSMDSTMDWYYAK